MTCFGRAFGGLGVDHVHGPVVDGRHPGVRPNRDAEFLELAARRRRSIRRVGRQDPLHGLDEDDLGVGRVDRPEIAPERVARDLAQRARQLDTGRPAADDHERHPLAPPFRIGFPFRGLECDEDAPPDLRGVLEGLEPGRHGLPLVVPEVGVTGAGRDDQRVVRDRATVGHEDAPPFDVDVDRLAEDHRGVALPAQDRPQRLGDLARRQGARRDLVQHRLEQVEVAPVDQRHRHLRVVTEAPGRVQPAEPASDDHHAVALRTAGRLLRHAPTLPRCKPRVTVRRAGVGCVRRCAGLNWHHGSRHAHRTPPRRPIPSARRPRAGRHGGRVPRPGRDAPARGRREGPSSGLRVGRGLRGAVPPRGAQCRVPAASEHRHRSTTRASTTSGATSSS